MNMLRFFLNLIFWLVGLLLRLLRLMILIRRRLTRWAVLGILHLQGHRGNAEHQGIVVCNGLDEHEWEFSNQIIKALRLLDDRDPRRGRMVRRRVKRILDGCTDYRAVYHRGQRICRINYQHYRDAVAGDYPIEGPTQDALTLRLAGLLVHIAARDRIRTRRFACRKDTQQRIERLCRRQESFFYGRVAGGTTDLICRPIDWWQESSCKPSKPGEILVLSQSIWEVGGAELLSLIGSLKDRFKDKFDDNESPPSKHARSEQPQRRWGERDAQHQEWFEQTPLISAHLLEQAAERFQCRGMLRAAILCYERLHEIVSSPRPETICLLAKLLYQTKQYERSEQIWQLAEERKEMFRMARSWRSAIYRQLGLFDDAKTLLESADIEDVNHGMLHQLACLDLERHDYESAEQRLRELTRNSKLTSEISDREFWVRAVLPIVAWQKGDADDFARQMSVVSAARDHWLRRHEGVASKRLCRIVDAPAAITQPGLLPGEISILTRLDNDISKDQLEPASRLATKISEAMQCDAFEGGTAYLQGLGYGDDESEVRRIRWNRVDRSNRLEGVWCVADVRVDRIFLDGGLICDPWIPMWVLPLRGEKDTVFVPAGILSQPSKPVASPDSFEQMRSFRGTMSDPMNSLE